MFPTKDGKMIILSSPSGAGKTTLVKKISKEKNYKISISHTTRAPRSNEIDGVDYFFITQENFQKLIKNDAFLRINQIGLQNLRFEGAEEIEDDKRLEWREGIIETMKKMGNYNSLRGEIEIIDQYLFKTEISFSSDISEGKYIVDTLLLKNEEIIGSKRSFINVSKSGLGEKIYMFATENSLIYGFFAVLIALFFGFLVNELIRRINA